MEKTKRLMKFLYFLCNTLIVAGIIFAVKGTFTDSATSSIVSMIFLLLAAIPGSKADELNDKKK